MSESAKPALRKRAVVGWRQVERERAVIRRRQRPAPVPKQAR